MIRTVHALIVAAATLAALASPAHAQAPPARAPQAPAAAAPSDQASRVSQLEAENAVLKLEMRALRARIDALEEIVRERLAAAPRAAAAAPTGTAGAWAPSATAPAPPEEKVWGAIPGVPETILSNLGHRLVVGTMRRLVMAQLEFRRSTLNQGAEHFASDLSELIEAKLVKLKAFPELRSAGYSEDPEMEGYVLRILDGGGNRWSAVAYPGSATGEPIVDSQQRRYYVDATSAVRWSDEGLPGPKSPSVDD